MLHRLSAALIGGIAAVAFVPIALAADLPRKAPAYAPPPPPPVLSWNGFYVGLNAGWIGSANDTIENTGTDTNGGGLGAALADGAIPGTLNLGLDGFIGGGQIGYNWQMGAWLVGLEADFQGVWTSNNTTSVLTDTLAFDPITSSFSRDLDWLATLRGRVGWLATPQVLLYATGGLAVGETTISNSFVDPLGNPPLNAFSETSDTQAGWTVGGGVEWMFAPRWSLKAEYLYVDLGDNDTTSSYAYLGDNSTLTSHVENTFHVVRGGINFHW